MTRLLFGLLILLGVVSAAAPARAWWNSDWNDRMLVTADTSPTGANVTTPIGRTVILVRLQQNNFNFDAAKMDGTDIRVIASDDKTPLKFHIERFDGLVDQVGLVWIDVADLAPSSKTSFYIYYGNKNANDGGDAKGTYDPDTVLDYHFGADNGLPKDVTAYGNNALTGGQRADGFIGYGLKLDGHAPVQIPASASLAIPAGQAMTWSVWANFAKGANSGVLYAMRDAANALEIGVDQGVAYASLTTANGTIRTAPGAKLPEDGWHLVTMTATDKLTVYVDGAPAGESPSISMPAMNAASILGGPAAAPPAPQAAPAPDGATPAPPAAAGATPPAPPAPDATASPPATVAAVPATPTVPAFAGTLDEFVISKVARSPGAIHLAWEDQGPDNKLLSFGKPEESSIFGTGYFGIIVRSVTIDAWVVIGILGFMAVVSWLVMIGKASYIGRVTKANRLFRNEFRQMVRANTEDPRATFRRLPTAKRPGLKKSTLFRLHDVGVRELEERLGDGRLGADGLLAPQSIAAMRAALDAQLSMETQRLNRMMVLLTIAISGGPFLGLLGTVVGVMITFAAIAQAGDVNVNSIAPGISAALLATVAGLAVAIPALFGYNYFLTRIRDVITEMNVFIDDLITRLGEGFSGASEPNGAAQETRLQLNEATLQQLADALLVRMTDTLRNRGGVLPQPGE